MLMFSRTLQAEEASFPTEENTPAGTCLDRQETKNLAKYVKNCQVQELDLTDCQLALGECTRGRGIQF